MNDPLFIPADFFIFRAPTMPAISCQSYLTSPSWSQELFDRFEHDDQFREAILIASPSLYHSVKKKPIKEPEKIANSLLYYAVRMATRATPFGLFSFVATGHWSDQTKIELTNSHLIKRTRPDMEWIWALIRKNYDEKLKNGILKIRTNPLIRLNGDRLTLDYFRYGKKNESASQTMSIRATELSVAILNCATKPITVKSILESVKNHVPNLNEEKAEKVILELFKQQFLLPALLPSLLNLSLSDLPIEGLENILQQMTEYDKLTFGKGERTILQLEEKMKTVATASSYLQVDFVYKDSSLLLSKNIVEEASSALELLWRISSNLKQKSLLPAYHTLFLERYGIYRTVPLLELLNQDQGLGPLENNPLLSSENKKTAFGIVWEKWLHNCLQECLYKREHEIVMTTTVLSELFDLAHEPTASYSEALPSCDLFCKIIAKSQEDIDTGNFNLLISHIFSEGGSSLGRFLDILGHPATDNLRAFVENEENTEPNAHFIELSFWPKQARSANVAIQPCLRKYILDIEEKERKPSSIHLDDIYVGATPSRLYLTDKNGEHEIITRVGNLLTVHRGPEPFRFLRAVTHQQYKTFTTVFWGDGLEHFNYIPRVKFKKTILAPACWNLDGTHFIKNSKDEIVKKFNEWADHWNLPLHCILSQGDNKLLVHRRHPACLKKIVNYLKAGDRIQFIEDLSPAWASGENGNHIPEIAIPFLRNNVYTKDKALLAPRAFHDISFDKRWQLFGSNCLFFKFYLGKNGAENFLIEHLSVFLKNIDLPWFFVRYHDPAHHLRVRIFVGPEGTPLITLSELEKISKFWMSMGFIQNYVVSNYEREIERYGGEHLIGCVEKLFCADSLSVIYLLKSKSKNLITIPPCILNSLSILYFLKGFRLDDKQIITLLERKIKNKKTLQGYREHRSLLNSLVQDFEGKEPASAEHVCFQEAQAFSQEAKAEFLENTRGLSEKCFYEIIDSLLHMHCNKLSGNNTEEEKARHFAYKALVQKKYIMSEKNIRKKLTKLDPLV